jgi:hypothetical protein
LKSKLLLLIVAVASALYVPIAAVGQVAPEKPPKDLSVPTYRNEVYVGWGYTSTNQVNLSRSGLQGVTGSIKRDFTDHFGVKFDNGYYGWDVSATNNPHFTEYMFLLGPVVHANLFERWSVFAEGFMGGVHTGGISIEPSVSLAGGPGVGLDWNRTQRWSVHMYGDYIASSFTLTPFQSGYSPHIRWNGRAGIGVAYHF